VSSASSSVFATASSSGIFAAKLSPGLGSLSSTSFLLVADYFTVADLFGEGLPPFKSVLCFDNCDGALVADFANGDVSFF